MTTDYMPSQYQNNRQIIRELKQGFRYQCSKPMKGLGIQRNFECACSFIFEHLQKLNIDPKLECIAIDHDFGFRFHFIQLYTYKDVTEFTLFST